MSSEPFVEIKVKLFEDREIVIFRDNIEAFLSVVHHLDGSFSYSELKLVRTVPKSLLTLPELLFISLESRCLLTEIHVQSKEDFEIYESCTRILDISTEHDSSKPKVTFKIDIG